MPGTTAQNIARLNAGYVKMAAALGVLHSVYRPAGAMAPVVPGNQIKTTLAAFAKNYTYLAPINPKLPQRFGMFDQTGIAVGDYFVNAATGDTYFVSNISDLQPMLCVACNRVISIATPPDGKVTAGTRPVGDVGQLGTVLNGPNLNTRSIIAAWPASVLYSGRGPSTDSKLPADQTSSQFTILLPPSVPVVLRNEYVISDDLLREYSVIAAEQNDGGWRLIANQRVL